MKKILVGLLIIWLVAISYFQYETTFGETLSGKLSRLDSQVTELDQSNLTLSQKLDKYFSYFETHREEANLSEITLSTKLGELKLLMEELTQRTVLLEAKEDSYSAQLSSLNKRLKKRKKQKLLSSKAEKPKKEVPSVLNINVWGSKRIAGIFCDKKFMGFYAAGDVLNKDWSVVSVSANSVTFVDSNGGQQTRYL